MVMASEEVSTKPKEFLGKVPMSDQFFSLAPAGQSLPPSALLVPEIMNTSPSLEICRLQPLCFGSVYCPDHFAKAWAGWPAAVSAAMPGTTPKAKVRQSKSLRGTGSSPPAPPGAGVPGARAGDG